MYKTIEECVNSIKNFSMLIDIQYLGYFSILNGISSILTFWTIASYYIIIIIAALKYLNDIKIDNVLMVALVLFVTSIMITKYILIKGAKKKLYDDLYDTKIRMSTVCFMQYIGYKDLSEDERVEIFKEKIYIPLNLIKIQKLDNKK